MPDHKTESIGKVIERLRTAFEAEDLCYGQGTDNPEDEARALVLGYLGIPWYDAGNRFAERLTLGQSVELDALARRRIEEKVPVPYLTGEAWFLGERYRVQPGIVLPRSPIGELIEKGFKPWIRQQPTRILDMCTGSGCIGIACAKIFPEAQVLLVDIDAQAVQLCRDNIALHNMKNRVEVLQSDLFDRVPTGLFDLIVSNPPYVNELDYAAAPREFYHEPKAGLYSGKEGLDVLDKLLRGAPNWLAEGGLLIGEAGFSAEALQKRFPSLAFTWPDLERGGHGVFVLEAGLLSA